MSMRSEFEVNSQCILPRHRPPDTPTAGHYRGPSETAEVAAHPGRDSGGVGRCEEHHGEPQHLQTGQSGEPGSHRAQELLLRGANQGRQSLLCQGEPLLIS